MGQYFTKSIKDEWDQKLYIYKRNFYNEIRFSKI